MAEIKDSPEKNYRISLTEFLSIFTLLFAVFGTIIYVSGFYFWHAYLDEMKLSPYQFPINLNDVHIVGWLFFLVVLGWALILFLFVMSSFSIVSLIEIMLQSKNIGKQEKIEGENIYSTHAHRKKHVVDKVFVGTLVGALTFGFIILFTGIWIGFLKNTSRSAAQEILKEINNSTTRLPKLALVLEDGQIYCPPGVRIVCSERFCGFNDGKNSTVVSLERVRSIQTELPAECPTAPPGSEAKSAATLFF